MALSRLKQGFESPRERQSPQQEPKKPALCGLFCFPGFAMASIGLVALAPACNRLEPVGSPRAGHAVNPSMGARWRHPWRQRSCPG
ncbi:protein of unknown function [Stenotrophomonas maltophilia]|nr:protein of unknown function [Stenotrophomonas maltophilia]